MRSSIIDHAWQQYPRKVYWVVTDDGALVGCTYDKEGGIRSWHDHVLGGKNTYVLQCETTKESNMDILWMIVRREIGGKLIVSLEYFPPPFNPVDDDIFEQQYTDSGVTIDRKYTIKNIENARSYFVNMDYNLEEFGYIGAYVNTVRDHLIIAFADGRYGWIDKIYDNNELEYYTLSEEGFFITAYGGNYNISDEHNDKMEYAYFLFPCSIRVEEIKNIGATAVDSLVWVGVNIPSLFTDISNELIIIKNSGYKDLDDKVFRIYNPGAKGFFLADEAGNPISIHLKGKLSELARIYVGKKEFAKGIASKDPKIEFDRNLFDETISTASLHTCRLAKVKGATKYNGEDFHLKLLDIDVMNERYTYGMYSLTEEDDLRFVANTYNYGVYDTLSEKNGLAYFYFDYIAEQPIRHLIGQDVCYTINGNWTYPNVFTLTESMIQDGKFRLDKSAIVVNMGLPYRKEGMLVPLSGGSLFGSSEGCVGTQKVIVLMMYASLGGQYGPSIPDDVDQERKLLDIPYPWNDEVDKEKQLVTAAIKVPIWGNKDTTIRTVYWRSNEPLSFNILSVVQDVSVSDG